ncbi:MAG: leucine-rich repeat domain-containing protein, partial [Eubacteriales bacterium]
MKKSFFMAISLIAALLLLCIPAFAGDNSFTSSNGLYEYRLDENNNAEITGYNGSETYVIISKIDGKYDVSSVSDGVFAGHTELKKITLPESLSKIGKSAFEGCTSLSEVVFSGTSSLKEIGERAFYGCSSLKSFNIPESTSIVGSYAFYACEKMTLEKTSLINLVNIGDFSFAYVGNKSEKAFSVTLGSSLDTLGNGAFFGCAKIDAFISESKNFVSENGILYSKDKKTLIAFPISYAGSSFALPEDVISIDDCAFAFSGLSEIDFGSSLKNIGSRAFYGASIERAEFPQSLESIGAYAFCGCGKLSLIDFGKSSPSLSQFVFNDCISLSRVTLPENIKEIPAGLFSGCTSLTLVDIPNGCMSIGEKAFYYCSSLSEQNIPETLTKIENSAFYGCSSLQNIDIKN